MKSKLTLLLTVALMIGALGVALTHRAKASAPAAAPASLFIGTWQTGWEAADKPGPNLNGPVTIKADKDAKGMDIANALDGVVEAPGVDGVMWGTLSEGGKTWSGNWWNHDGPYGAFTFTLTGNKRFDGTYTIAGRTGSFKWWGCRGLPVQVPCPEK
jgi:hypothetical protein